MSLCVCWNYSKSVWTFLNDFDDLQAQTATEFYFQSKILIVKVIIFYVTIRFTYKTDFFKAEYMVYVKYYNHDKRRNWRIQVHPFEAFTQQSKIICRSVY